ncbi:MAG: hypothetical protein BAJATHORv1_10535 [Candidatus Thorarchaeota archaeon]|nr:MAG: hypothetical protein BAJATHORv1_10535 [Candidatus Thorarchaeota archaeon]
MEFVEIVGRIIRIPTANRRLYLEQLEFITVPQVTDSFGDT